jgi:tRNA (mo5U34)-methyltransferase
MGEPRDPSRETLEEMVRAVGWWHSIDLGRGLVTPGFKSAALLAQEWATLGLPDLRGKTVLDIGALDGWFSFEAERRNAARVVAVDYPSWCTDHRYGTTYVPACRARGEVPAQPHETPFWRPDELPGKRPFDLAHRALGSKVEARVADFMTMPLDESFDVVLYLGVLYHLKDPLGSLERVAAVTKELAVIESACVRYPERPEALCEFLESDELMGDVTNWWVPNERALLALCRAAGFRRVELATPPPRTPGRERRPRLRRLAGAGARPLGTLRSLVRRMSSRSGVVRYRATVRAWK